MTYADIILPLPLDSLFTYSVPDNMRDRAQPGVRVTVPFGRTKKYTGLIMRVHDVKPKFRVRSVIEVLDESPVVTSAQRELWQWIADYYMSPPGDVYNAALPAGLKAEDAYRPKTETYVTLTPEYRSGQALHIALDVLQRAAKQRDVFREFLRMSHWDSLLGTGTDVKPAEVSRDELVNQTHCTFAVFRALVVRKFLCTYEREVGRLNSGGESHLDSLKKLSAPQQDAYNQILFSFLKKPVTLLHGVTSSGKTEIYIHLIRQTIERGEQVLYLLPEIALTVQIQQRLRQVLGNRLGIYHSKYSDAERVEIWRKQLSSAPYDVILGARSAVFLPFTKLGLVIIDEEHESSFKQQEPSPRYHARSVAVMLARQFGAKVLLGSATPSLESWSNAAKGKYGLVTLTRRYKDVQMPEIEVVDIKDLQRRKMMNGPFSPALLTAIRSALDRKEQVILFQNRRGFAPMIECRECGWVPKCGQCDVSLTYHKALGQLTCHYCGASYPVPEVCPCCGSRDLRGRGYGTEKIEDRVAELFPDARIARMDLDTTHTRNAYERIINDFSAHRTNLLIGTQMVSKGLDFDKVSVVGILNADSMLSNPDFRAYEHAFMMMSQVSGRAGRKDRRGLVILQTKSPQLPVIGQVVRNDCAAFYADQLEERRIFRYPPYSRLIYVYLKHRDDAVAARAAAFMGSLLRQWFGTRVLGPDRPPVARVKAMSIRKIVLKLEAGLDLNKVRLYLRKAQESTAHAEGCGQAQVYFDVDPV